LELTCCYVKENLMIISNVEVEMKLPEFSLVIYVETKMPC
jgi:hypothetical protein